MKITPILWKHNKLKDGTFPVKIRIQDGNKTTYHGTGASVLPAQWKNGKVVTRVNAKEINDRIRETIQAMERNYFDGGTVTAGDKKSLFWWFERRIEISKTKHSVYHYEKQKTVLNKLKKFRPVININHINHTFLVDFQNHLLKQKYHINYVADILIRLKVVVRDMIKDGVLEYHKNPFLNFKSETKRTVKKRLSLAEIKKLEAVKLSAPLQAIARDMYIFSFNCAGIRFGDLCRLKHSMVDSGRLNYTAHKTDKPRSIRLNSTAKNIIKRAGTVGYIFNTGVNWDDEDQSINSRNSAFNTLLKKACQKAKIPEVTFHTSRNSFADLAIKNKIDIHTLKELLGHSNVTTTEIYANGFYQEETDSEMEKLLGA